MSGQATGWVLRHGPTDRAMRSVLLCISDAANADGKHAHPGIEAIMRGSLYQRAHVLATIRKLKAEGWITETAPRSPGHAATYAIPGVSEVQPVDEKKVQPLDLRTERGPIEEPLRSNPARPEVQSAGSSLSCSTKTTNGTTNVCVGSDFDTFWSAYPKRNGQRLGRADAEGIWRRMSAEDRRAARVHVEHYRAACDAGLTIAKDAHRWLTKDRWRDWSTPATPVLAHAGHRNGSDDHGASTSDFLALAAQLREEGQ